MPHFNITTIFLILLLFIACGDEPIEPGPIVMVGGRSVTDQSTSQTIAPEGPPPTPLPVKSDTSSKTASYDQPTTQSVMDSVNVTPPIGSDAWYVEVGKRSGVIDPEGHGPTPRTQEWYSAVSRKSGVIDSQGHGPDFDSEEWRNAVHKKLFQKKTSDTSDKIKFDLNKLDSDGLEGSTDGKRSLDYEFAIPDTPENRAAVRAIDPSVKFMPGSKGRIGAGKGQVLCIGSTHQANYRAILLGLARLDFIDRIVECFYE